MVPATDQRFTTFTIAHLHGRSLVAVAGDIDLATAPDLHTHLCAAIDAMISNAGGVVIVDLSAVTFMDASGLTALIRAEARAWERGARLHLRALAPCVTRLLQLTGLGQHFEVCPTRTGDRFPGGRRPKAAKRGTPVLTH
ncbi:MAG: anti-anti-sigma factor [Actinomycetia bacterium]|nr:anti-anti-sigma factor [Actinomycetes bacterium]